LIVLSAGKTTEVVTTGHQDQCSIQGIVVTTSVVLSADKTTEVITTIYQDQWAK
jgi:hypothetical protein